MATDTVVLELNGHDVPVTNPGKVFFSSRGETKLDLVKYYLSVEAPLMRAMGGRPVLLERYPDGASGKSFFQKRVPKGAPEWLQTTVVSTPNGTLSNALVATDLAHVVWAVNMGCLGFHVWPYLAASPDFADELRIDLDPQPGVGFEQVREAAREVKSAFDELQMTVYVKTSGRRGLHVYARLASRWDSYAVRAAAVALAREMARRRPDLITDAWWKEERGQRVFVDFNQNAPHKTVFGAWSVRPRVRGQVSAPISWDEVDDVEPEDLTLAAVGARVAEIGDPWRAMDGEPASLERLLQWHARDMADGLMDAPWPPVYPKMPNEPPRVAPSRAAQVQQEEPSR
ncbi:MAG: non-homologous end-joining DNA ligase [Acidimicrobiaceae bacterium]|nr:non-homologous end-joining DNA ligase [Acidimicrobiaceae bacterium]